MRFLLRSLLGLILFAAGLAAAGYGGLVLKDSLARRGAGASFGAPGASERVFSVRAGEVMNGVHRPVITAYGEIRSWRTLEMRASAGGRLVELSDAFRDGETVAAGDLLFRIDPEPYAARVADARVALAEAEAELAEAEQSIEVARRELEAAETQKALRERALERQKDLLAKGVATSKLVEDAEMAVASAEQAAANRAQMTLTAQNRIDRDRLKVERARIALENAERDLAETEYRAPFPGLLAHVNAALGKLVSPNEKLGELIDPTALEAVFRVTNAQFARLLGEDGALKPTELTVTLDLDRTPLTVSGVVDRAGAVIGEGQTGRLVYARLDIDRATLLRPGDFVTVRIVEPPLENVARLPSSAVTEDGRLLIVGAGGRLEEAQVRILRRMGDDVIVSGAPEGALYVLERAPQLGRGVRVRVLAPDDGEEGEDAPQPPAMVDLTPEQQKRIIAMVEANDGMPADAKNRLLSLLRAGKAPQNLMSRIAEGRQGG